MFDHGVVDNQVSFSQSLKNNQKDLEAFGIIFLNSEREKKEVLLVLDLLGNIPLKRWLSRKTLPHYKRSGCLAIVLKQLYDDKRLEKLPTWILKNMENLLFERRDYNLLKIVCCVTEKVFSWWIRFLLYSEIVLNCAYGIILIAMFHCHGLKLTGGIIGIVTLSCHVFELNPEVTLLSYAILVLGGVFADAKGGNVFWVSGLLLPALSVILLLSAYFRKFTLKSSKLGSGRRFVRSEIFQRGTFVVVLIIRLVLTVLKL